MTSEIETFFGEGFGLLRELGIVAGQVFTLFLMMGVGFGLEKKGWFSADTSAQVTKLLIPLHF